jgi:hypothetical protein
MKTKAKVEHVAIPPIKDNDPKLTQTPREIEERRQHLTSAAQKRWRINVRRRSGQ